MENRFGVKDFFLFLVLGFLIVLVVLGMFQYDRQWAVVQQTNRQLTELTGDVARIRRELDQGISVGVKENAGGPTSAVPAMAGFERVLAVHALPDYSEGDSLVQIMTTAPNKLTPLISTDEYSQIVQSYVQDPLCSMDPDTLKWIPRLAESWKISDDQLTIDFFLRKGITFSDGSPFSADDVVFTYDWMMNPLVEAPRARAYLDRLSKVEKINDYHVRFTFKEPYFVSFDTAAGQGIMSKAFYSKYSPTDFNQSTGLLIGTGPYRMPDPTAWRPEPGKPIEVVRNERYWGPRPSFDKMVWKVIENPTARTTAFENGETDIFGPGVIGPTPEQYEKMLQDTALIARTQHFDLPCLTIGYYYVGWNEKQGRDGAPTPFADKRVRQAMTMLVDREAIVRDIMRGYATVATGPFSPLSPQADPNVKPWPYDPVAAQKLLADAGFTKQGDRIVGPDGKPFTFKLSYATASSIAKRMAPMIHDSFAQAGIDVQLDPLEWSVLLKRLDDRQIEAVTMGWGGTVHDDPYQIFHSSQIAGTGDNFVQYSSKELDAALESARSVVDEEKDMPLWHKVCDILHEDQPYTFLYSEKELTFMDKRIRGAKATSINGINGPDEWYVPKALQKYTQ